MRGSLIKERKVLENELATLDLFIDRWCATTQPESFYIKIEESDKGPVWRGALWLMCPQGGAEKPHHNSINLRWNTGNFTVTRYVFALDRKIDTEGGTILYCLFLFSVVVFLSK